MKKAKEIPLLIPPAMKGIDHWLVMGLDPSLSRTGYALMGVAMPRDYPDFEPCPHPGCLSHDSHPCDGCGRTGGITYSRASWLDVGSVKPEKASTAVWIRSKGIALFLKERLYLASLPLTIDGFKDDLWHRTTGFPGDHVGLLISTEFPTPMNDFLVALNRVIHLVLFDGDLWKKFAAVRVLSTNASTMRSLMGLHKKGTTNKKENILRAYDYIDREKFPTLDPDSCDAVLLAMLGRHAVSILLGREKEVPQNVVNTFCSNEQKAKGKGRNMHIITAGIMHRPEYFYEYSTKPYVFCSRDAASRKTGLERKELFI